jgi:hypothetical protein
MAVTSLMDKQSGARAEASQKRINEFLNTKTNIISEKELYVRLKGR